MTAFQFRDGYPHPKDASPNAIAARLESLRKQNNGLTPEQVVEEARRPTSPLHSSFDWDDSTAAEKWRLQQARGLIAAIVMIVGAPTAPTIRAFAHVQQDGQDVYQSMRVIMDDVDMKAQVLRRARAEFQAFQKRYQDLEEYAEVFAAAAKIAS